MTNYAAADVVEAKAATWTDAQVDCRLNRHNWNRKMTAVTHHKGFYTIEQSCGRRCGVRRRTEINEQGFQVSWWRMDYSEAKGYLMVDDDGKSLGRIDTDGRARLWLATLASITVVEAPDE